MSSQDPLLHLLARFGEEGVEYVLIGGQAVRLNGYVRATEDIGGTPVRVLDIDGLIMTKTDYREKDVLDKRVLLRIKQSLQNK